MTGRFRDRRLNPDAAIFVPAAALPAHAPAHAQDSDEEEKHSVASLPLSQISDGQLVNADGHLLNKADEVNTQA